MTDEIGLNPPEHRGDRYWMFYGEGGEAVDTEAVTADLLDLLENAFGLSNDEVDAVWQLLPR